MQPPLQPLCLQLPEESVLIRFEDHLLQFLDFPLHLGPQFLLDLVQSLVRRRTLVIGGVGTRSEGLGVNLATHLGLHLLLGLDLLPLLTHGLSQHRKLRWRKMMRHWEQW